MTAKTDFARRLAMIAFWLDFAGDDGTLNSQAFRRRIERAGDFDSRALKGWFAGARQVKKRNRARLAAAIAAIAREEGRDFSPDWLEDASDILARRLKIDLTRFASAGARALSAPASAGVVFDFQIPEDFAQKLRTKYAGVFHCYRIGATSGRIVRDALAISPNVRDGVAPCLYAEPRRSFRGHILIAQHNLLAQLYSGGGAGLVAESLFVERHTSSQNVFAGVKSGLNISRRLPIASKCVLWRAPDLDAEKIVTENDVDSLRAEVAILDREQRLEETLRSHLIIGETQTQSRLGLSADILAIDGATIASVFENVDLAAAE